MYGCVCVWSHYVVDQYQQQPTKKIVENYRRPVGRVSSHSEKEVGREALMFYADPAAMARQPWEQMTHAVKENPVFCMKVIL